MPKVDTYYCTVCDIELNPKQVLKHLRCPYCEKFVASGTRVNWMIKKLNKSKDNQVELSKKIEEETKEDLNDWEDTIRDLALIEILDTVNNIERLMWWQLFNDFSKK